ncbi:MAG: hypothetical protein JST00_00715 [Deltaproteobacteria bacterium]|nr:hypothetical protein [Deltaproteobacteria bacterium]
MSLRRAALLVALTASACDAGAPVNAPVAGGSSHLEISMKQTTYTVDGIAFARRSTTDKVVVVTVVENGTQPQVTCENVAMFGGVMQKGALGSVSASDFEGKPGRYPIIGYGYVRNDPEKGDSVTAADRALLASDVPDPSSMLQIDTLDGSSFSGTIAITRPAGSTAKGRVAGTFCPVP